MTDALRLPYWMRISEDVSDVSGSLEDAGTNYRLQYGLGMHARIEVLEAERPARYVIRGSAFRASETAVVTLDAVDSSTAFRVEIEHRAALGVLGRNGVGPVADRLRVPWSQSSTRKPSGSAPPKH